MTVRRESFVVQSGPGFQVHDLTPRLSELVARAGLRDGLVHVFVPGSTAAVTTVEYEPGLVRDLEELFERLAPADRPYHHDARWHDRNGHAHVRASLVGPDLTLPVGGGRLRLGTWQQVVLLDFDPPARQRRVEVTLYGAF